MDGTDSNAPPEPKKIGRPRTGRTMYQTSISLGDGDVKIVKYIQEALGSASQADAIRSALRAYAMHLERILGK